MTSSWPKETLDALLDEAKVRGTLELTLENEATARRLRWALYARKNGARLRLSIRGPKLTLTVPTVPKILIQESPQ